MLIRKEFSERLNTLLDYYDYPKKGRQYRFREEVGVSPETSRKWLTGEAMPRKEKIIEISTLYPCRPEWLEYGTGLMIDDPNISRAVELLIAATPENRALCVQLLEQMTR